MNNPQLGIKALKKARKFDLKNGIHLEIAWHYGLQGITTEITYKGKFHPTIHHDGLKMMFRHLRMEIVELVNPQVKAVRLRLVETKEKTCEIHPSIHDIIS